MMRVAGKSKCTKKRLEEAIRGSSKLVTDTIPRLERFLFSLGMVSLLIGLEQYLVTDCGASQNLGEQVQNLVGFSITNFLLIFSFIFPLFSIILCFWNSDTFITAFRLSPTARFLEDKTANMGLPSTQASNALIYVTYGLFLYVHVA